MPSDKNLKNVAQNAGPKKSVPIYPLASASEDTDVETQEAKRRQERLTAYGKKTLSYYEVSLEKLYNEMNELFPGIGKLDKLDIDNMSHEDLVIYTIEEPAPGQSLTDKLVQDIRIAKMQSQNGGYNTTIMFWKAVLEDKVKELSDYLNYLVESLGGPIKNDPEPVDMDLLKKQCSLLNDMKSVATGYYYKHAADPMSRERNELYHNLGDRLKEVDARIKTLTPRADKDPNVFMLAATTRESLQNMQRAIAKDAVHDTGAANDIEKFDNLKKTYLPESAKALAVVYLYQQIENCALLSTQDFKPNDGIERKAEIMKNKQSANAILAGFRNNSLGKSIDNVKYSDDFKAFEAKLNVSSLNNAMKQPGGLAKAFKAMQAERQKQKAPAAAAKGLNKPQLNNPALGKK